MQKSDGKAEVLFKDIHFEISINKKPEFIINKMKLGRISGKKLILNAYECLYLYLKKVICPLDKILNSTAGILSVVIDDEGFLDRFMVYTFLKSKGLFVDVVGKAFFWDNNSRKPMNGPVVVIKEDQKVSFKDLLENSGQVYAAIDDDYGITLFTSEIVELRGNIEAPDLSGIHVEQISGINMVSERKLPDWFGNRFSDLKILNKSEAALLSDNDDEKKALGSVILATFSDLVQSGFIVRSGFKYGANFRLYSKSMDDHAEFLLHVIEEPEEWYKISRAVRVAQGVRKTMVFAGDMGGKISYIKINRVKDNFFSNQT